MGKLSYLLALLSLVSINIYVADSYTLTASVLNQLGYSNKSFEIDIKDNNIDNIDPNAFNGYGSLYSLAIKSNGITIIDLVAFKDPVNLYILSLDLPSLIRIKNPNNVKLPCLNVFTLSGDMSKSIEIANNVTNGIGNITSLSLYSQLNPLKSNQLVGLNKLTELILMNANQTSLTKAMFNGLTSLKALNLDGNYIKTIDVHTFESLPNLLSVNVDKNLITSFEYLQIPNKLSSLNLQTNNMNYFALSRTMGFLDALYINNNRFRSFKSMDFNFLANLTNLYLKDNPHAYPYEIAGHMKPLAKLEVVNLANLSISSIDANYFQNNIKLRIIQLNNNKISSINNRSFIGPTNLEFIDLSYNNMSKITTGTFNCTNMQFLNLANNQITELETSSFYGANPVGLVFSHNKINKIFPRAFDSLNIVDIYFDFNQLTELDNLTFSGIEQIGLITLSYNKINKIGPGSFKNLKGITSISLEYNLLTELKNGTFAELDQLHSVYLRFNNLSTIEPGTFANLPKLKDVSLDGNQLTQLDSSIFAGSNNLEIIYLRDIPNLSTANIQSLCPPAAIGCQVVY